MHAMIPFGFVTDCMALIKTIMFIIHVPSYKLKCMGPCEIYIWPAYALTHHLSTHSPPNLPFEYHLFHFLTGKEEKTKAI